MIKLQCTYKYYIYIYIYFVRAYVYIYKNIKTKGLIQPKLSPFSYLFITSVGDQ